MATVAGEAGEAHRGDIFETAANAVVCGGAAGAGFVARELSPHVGRVLVCMDCLGHEFLHHVFRKCCIWPMVRQHFGGDRQCGGNLRVPGSSTVSSRVGQRSATATALHVTLFADGAIGHAWSAEQGHWGSTRWGVKRARMNGCKH